jgi:hypothetical protein
MRDALAIVAIASELRLGDPELEAARLKLLRTVLDSSHDASEAMRAWVHQLRSGYRGSQTAWDFERTSAQLRSALERFDTTLEEAAIQLHGMVPDTIDRALESRDRGS